MPKGYYLPESRRGVTSILSRYCGRTGVAPVLLFLRRVRRAPEKPRRRRGMRTPAFAELEQVFGLRHLAFFIRDAKTGAHAKIIGGQNVLAAQLKNQKHLDRPAPDAANLGQPRDDFIVGQFPDLDRKSTSL